MQQGEGEADKENLGQCGVPGKCRGVSASPILVAGIYRIDLLYCCAQASEEVSAPTGVKRFQPRPALPTPVSLQQMLEAELSEDGEEIPQEEIRLFQSRSGDMAARRRQLRQQLRLRFAELCVRGGKQD